MAIARITGQGLVWIALSTGLLWAVWIGETVMWQRAVADRARVMRDLRRVPARQAPRPVSAPLHRSFHRSPATNG